jgi:hypothetical protein
MLQFESGGEMVHGGRGVREDNSESPLRAGLSGRPRGRADPFQLAGRRPLPAQVVASLLQTFHHDKTLYFQIRGPAFRVPTESSHGNVYRRAANPLRHAFIIPRESIEGRACCPTRASVGTRHAAVRTHDLHCWSCLRQPNSLSIVVLHFGPNRLIAQIVRLLDSAHRPKIVKSHPFPIAFMTGAATIAPTQENMFRTKLLTATPLDDCLGMNSVSMVVAMAKMSIDPIP